jgi:integrase
MEGDKLTGRYIDVRRGKVSFRAYAEDWLATRTIDEATRVAIDGRLRTHVFPSIADKAIASIRPSTVQAMVSGFSCAPSTASVVLSNVSSIFSAAVDDEIIAKNPCSAKSVKAPAATKEKFVPWTAEQVLAVVARHPEQYRAIPVLAAGCGLRQGECFAVAKGDVELGWLAVTRQVKRVKGTLSLALPKGRKTRRVPLPQWVAHVLAQHIDRYPPPDDETPLFSAPRGGLVNSANFNDGVWDKALEAAGIGAARRNGMHMLRHTFASTLLAEGESIAAVAEWLGHASPTTTLRIYSHVMPRAEDRARKVIDGAFGPGSETDGVTMRHTTGG